MSKPLYVIYDYHRGCRDSAVLKMTARSEQDRTCQVRFELITEVTMKNVVFSDLTPCGSCKKHISEESITSIFKVENQPKILSNHLLHVCFLQS
jgi:deoxycytidylate deaminase